MNEVLQLRRELSSGGRVPRGWRMAWYEPRRRVGVYYPRPLHWLLRILREVRYRVRVALHVPPIERVQVFEMQRGHAQRLRLADEYARGYLVGWRECFQTCIEVVEDELACTKDAWEIGALLTDGQMSGKQN
jgi:hypothetical protein